MPPIIPSPFDGGGRGWGWTIWGPFGPPLHPLPPRGGGIFGRICLINYGLLSNSSYGSNHFQKGNLKTSPLTYHSVNIRNSRLFFNPCHQTLYSMEENCTFCKIINGEKVMGPNNFSSPSPFAGRMVAYFLIIVMGRIRVNMKFKSRCLILLMFSWVFLNSSCSYMVKNDRHQIYKRHLLNTAQLCWADENRFAEDEMF